MAEQMILSAEPMSEPQGELAPTPAVSSETPTFGNMPQGTPSWVPSITLAEETAEPEAPASEVQASAPAGPPPAAEQPQAPVSSGQELFAAMAMYDQWKRQQDAQAKSETESANWTPPEIPEKLAEEMLTDPKVLKEFIQQRDAWHRNAAVQMVKPLADQVAALREEQDGVAYRDHQEAWQEVRERMEKKGVQADKYYGPVIQALQQNPRTANTIMRNPKALLQAVEFIRAGEEEAQSNFTGKPETPQKPPTLGSRPGNASAEPSYANKTDPAIEKAERAFGRKFTPTMKKEYFATQGGKR